MSRAVRMSCSLVPLLLILFPAIPCCAASFISTGDGGWERQDLPAGLPPETDLYSVCCVGMNTAFAVGEDGTILNTTDGGASWVSQTSGTTELLRSVSFGDANVGCAVGDNGTIRRTADGGATWVTSTSGATHDLRSVHFIDACTGWIVGGFGSPPPPILKTTNGGQDWVPQDPPSWYPNPPYYTLDCVHFADASLGCAVGDGPTVIKTTSGGVHWWFEMLKVEGRRLCAVHFADSTTGWAAGDNAVVFKTTDAGDSWTAQQAPRGFAYDLLSIHFADTSTGWMVGSEGIVCSTTDGGAVWVRQNSGTGGILMSVCSVDPNTAWVVGREGTILHTSTGGIPGCPWAKQQSDGEAADFGHLVVTAEFDGHIYAEHPERASGIRINTTDPSVNEGDFIYIHGTVDTTGLERTINADSIEVMTAEWGNLAPQGMTNVTLGGGDLGSPPEGQCGVTGGSGPNSVGLLVKCWGQVADVVPAGNYMLIDDGSGPVRVDTSHLTTLPDVDDHISVTGISSLYGTVGDVHSLLIPRRDSDVAPL